MESNDRPRSRGSNREEADMAISDVEQVRTIVFFQNSTSCRLIPKEKFERIFKACLKVPSDNESSTPSQPTKIVTNGHLQGSEKNETRLKQILESKRLNRQNKENVDNSGAKADLRQQLDKQYPEPPSPDKTV